MSTAFTPAAWAHSTNIYEVNLRQYTAEGTFAAFAEHLPRLKDMGIEVIWLMPVTPISEKNRKGSLGSYYACSSYVKINPEFGTIDEFKSLVKQIHDLGMRVIIDWVANHTGWDHEWTLTHPEYYTQDDKGHFKPPVESWEDVIHLNFYNPALRNAMIEAMRFWITDCSIDGFRCDMAMLVPAEFWFEARTALDAERELFWLGEFDQWGDEPYAHVFDASYTWHWMHTTEEFSKGKRKMVELDHVLSDYHQKKPFGHLHSFFTSNHDENSWNGTEYEKYGNLAIPLAVFSCTWNGVPLIYSGQELPNKKRLRFFDKDEIEWTGDIQLHNLYKKLLQLRKAHPALLAAHRDVITWRIATDYPDQLFCFVRMNQGRAVIVVLNFSDAPLTFQLHDLRVRGMFENVFTGEHKDATDSFFVDAWGYSVMMK
ncbi:MAG: alpha-amylase family glycosyl hydrolase [Lacibacter sp.]